MTLWAWLLGRLVLAGRNRREAVGEGRFRPGGRRPASSSRSPSQDVQSPSSGPCVPDSVSSAQLADLWTTPPDPTLEADLKALGGQLTDPWATT
jgi:hypothetical protein